LLQSLAIISNKLALLGCERHEVGSQHHVRWQYFKPSSNKSSTLPVTLSPNTVLSCVQRSGRGLLWRHLYARESPAAACCPFLTCSSVDCGVHISEADPCHVPSRDRHTLPQLYLSVPNNTSNRGDTLSCLGPHSRLLRVEDQACPRPGHGQTRAGVPRSAPNRTRDAHFPANSPHAAHCTDMGGDCMDSPSALTGSG
jgi:hypothetical protein